MRVENLAKLYRLGELSRHWTIGDRLAALVRGSREPGRAAERDEIWALRDVSFEVQPGEVVGIIGRNGAGKSTLLKILSRITEPTRGAVELRGRVSSLLEVGTGFHPELTGRESVYLNGSILGMKKAEIDRKFDAIVDFSGVERFLDTPVKRYSSGMQVRLAFAVAAHLEPEILIVDEVLAVGDAEFQRKCLGKMGDVASGGRTVLFVSHNMAAVANLCRRAVLLDSGSVQADGEVRPVITRYLSIQGSLAADVDASSHCGRLPQTVSVIKRFAILNRRGLPDGQVPLGDPVTFRLELESNRTLSNAAVAIHIYNNLGSRIVTFHTSAQLPTRLTVSGRQVVDCHVPSLPLVPDTYAVVVGIDCGPTLVDRIDPVLRFEVVQKEVLNASRLPSSSDGAVVLPGRWSVRTQERSLRASTGDQASTFA